MVKSLTVFYLHKPSRLDARRLPAMEYGLADAFRDFCRETFDTREARDYPPLKLVAVFSAEQLAAALLSSPGRPTEKGRTCCLFLIDDDLLGSTIREMTLRTWLKAFFPAIPRVLVTHPGHAETTLPARRWTKKQATVFEHPARHHERIVHLFKSFWAPRFWGALRQYVQVKAGTNWHTPGHNGGRGFATSPFLRGFHEAFGSTIFRSDLSVSVESLGDLSSPEGRTPLSEAQKLTSEIFGTAQSCYVTNGTSTSNKAMLQTLLRPGETVLVDRNCHKSVHHAIVMSGAVPRYLPARWNATLGVWGPVALTDIRSALAGVPATPAATRPRMLILTVCTYEGVLYPSWEIGRLCEAAGVLFYADEAWAPYLPFHPFYTHRGADGAVFRYSAVNESAGAHFSVQSTHKALAAFSQASMVHVSDRFKRLLEDDATPGFRWLRRRFALHGHGSYEKFSHDFHEILRYWHSTSPHYPFMATLDTAGIEMRLEGLQVLDDRLRWVAAFRKRVAAECGKPEDECFATLAEIAGGTAWVKDGYLKDPLKLVLMFRSARGCETFRKALLKARIQWEKASSSTILFLVTTGTVEEHFEYLFRVCREHKHLIGRPATKGATDTGGSVGAAVAGQAAVLPRDAALCDGELVPLEQTEGRIASQFLVPYPPGIPVFIPGLRITKAMIRLIQDVIAAEGPGAVHGLFCRGDHAPYLVEVLNKDEEQHAQPL